MTRCLPIVFVLFVLFVLFAGLPAAARPVGPFDTAYPYGALKQKVAIRSHVKKIVWPTLISPSLVRFGGRFEVLLRPTLGADGRPMLPEGAAAAWHVWLTAPGLKPQVCRLLGAQPEGRFLRLRVQLSAALARDVYDLRIVAPGIDDTQPNAVRILAADEPSRFRFVVMTDHQLWDPSFSLQGRPLNTNDFPRATAKQHLNEAITRQGLAEISLLDPAFVLHTGDLIFGLDFTGEYQQARRELVAARLPVFAIPGNHDGYAIYTVRLRGGAYRLLTGALACQKHIGGDLSWGRLWLFISCVYGDVKELLYADLQQDGLAFWKRQLGPTEYAFDHGAFRFIGINTYAGTPERRHAFSIYMDVFDLHLGAPAVDNYGGYLTEAQLKRVEAELRSARQRGLVPVLFGHHDPRGNEKGQRYHPNEPFPTDPLGLEHFEEWNYDSKQWDSNPKDARHDETPEVHSGRRLLALLARYGGYYICGHVHADSRKSYAVGSHIGPFRVERPLELIRTTSAASSVKPGAYWGYRVIEAEGSRLRVVDFSEAKGLGSLPAGNIWQRDLSAGTKAERELVNALPEPVTLRIRWALPTRPEGYRFRLGVAPDQSPLPALAPPRVVQVASRGGQTIYWVRVTLPAATIWPPQKGSARRLRLRALAARDNKPPEPNIELAVVGGLALQKVQEPHFEVAPGQPVLLSAEGSRDAEGDRIIWAYWDFGGGHGARGLRVVHTFAGGGEQQLRLTLVDEAGARQTVVRTLRVQPPRPPTGGCGCRVSAAEETKGLGAAVVALLLLLGARRRRRRRPWRAT